MISQPCPHCRYVEPAQQEELHRDVLLSVPVRICVACMRPAFPRNGRLEAPLPVEESALLQEPAVQAELERLEALKERLDWWP